MKQQQLLTYQDVADRLKCSVSQVRSYRRSGKLKPVKFGRQTVRFKESDVEKLIKEHY